MNDTIIITKLVRTCSACPSQWDGYDAVDNYYYFRYRHGNLTVSTSAWYYDGSEVILSKSFGDTYAGYLSFEELKELTKEQITFDCAEEIE